MESLENINTAEISSNDLFEYFKDSKAKVEIISKLPKDFPEQVIKYVKEVEKECERTGEEFDLESRIRGRAFEILVKEELFGKEKGTLLESKISEEIQDLISNPEKYQLREYFKLGRIPDVAYVGVNETGHVTILFAIEAKTALLDKRARNQLKKGAFLETFRSLTRSLNKFSRETLNKRGLKALAEVRASGNVFTVSSKFEPRLVVPSDRRIGFQGFEGTLINTEFFKGHEKDMFEKELKKMDIQNSVFSNEDLRVFSKYISERM